MSNRFFLLVAAVFALSLCSLSCNMVPDSARNVHIMSVGLTYSSTGEDRWYLDHGPANDTLELTSILSKIFSERGCNVAEHLFLEGDDNFNLYMEDGNGKVGNEFFPTKANVLSKFSSIVSDAGPDDLVVFIYSGHGNSGDGGLCLLDDKLQKTDLGMFYTKPSPESILTPSDLRAALSDAGTNVLLILDSCYSGNFGINGDVGEFGDDISKMNPEGFSISAANGVFTSTLDIPNVTVICASTAKQTSLSFQSGGKNDFDGESHGFMIGYLIKALGGTHDSSKQMRVFSKELLHSKKALACHGIYPDKIEPRYDLGHLYGTMCSDVKRLLQSLNSKNLKQDPQISCSSLDFSF